MSGFHSSTTHMKSMLPGAERSSWFANLRLGFKLAVVLGVFLALMAALGAFAMWGLGSAHMRASSAVGNGLPRLEAAITVERDTYEAMLNFTAYALSGDEAEYSGGRQSLARIKDAVNRLRQMARDSMVFGAEGPRDPFSDLVDKLFDEISRFDSLAEETRTLVQDKEKSWAAFNRALADVDHAFEELRDAAQGTGAAQGSGTGQARASRPQADGQTYRDLVTLQGDFHALRAAISTALASDSGMTLHSLGTDFARHSTRLLGIWQPYRAEKIAASPEGTADEMPDLLNTLGGGRMALASLTADIERSRELSRQRRNSAAAIASLARDMSREEMGTLGGEMDGSRSTLIVLLAFYGVLLALSVGGCLVLFYVFGKNVIRPMQEISAFAKRASEGDSTSTLTFARNDELGELAHALRALAGAQREAMSRMQHKEREAEQQKRKASQLIERASDAMQEARKREEEIQTLIAALKDRDMADAARAAERHAPQPGQPVQPAQSAQPGPSARTEKAAVAAHAAPAMPHSSFEAPLPADEFMPVTSAGTTLSGTGYGPETGVSLAAAAPSLSAGNNTASAAPETGKKTGSKQSEEALHDLAKLSAGMRTLIRQLSDK
ncbi:HAMP domain-containing protein [Desulfovibrio sp. OttesenSCG-928-I05]|nr:HAMP domain-containing protein [Desulfovibrio sp. OttesenSCG-928-I05]